MRSLAPRLVACALLGAGAAQAEPFTLNHLLSQQSLGPVSIDPSQRWLVAPVTAPYRSAPRWDLKDKTRKTITQLRVFDLRHGGPARAYPAQVGTLDAWGYTPGPYSPSGDKMAITRARGRFLEVGVLTLATGATVWTGLYPVTDLLGGGPQWRSDTELLVLAKAPDLIEDPDSWQTESRLAQKWAASASGRPGVTVMGSGRYLGLIPDPTLGKLVSVDPRTGHGRVLAEGPFLDLAVAPGGRHAALLVRGRPFAADPKTPVFTTDPRRRFRLQIVDLTSSKTWTPCADCDLAPSLMAWSPSGRSLLIHARQDDQPWSAATYRRLDLDTRLIRALQSPTIATAVDALSYGRMLPRADWMGDTPVLQARPASRPDAETDWFAWREAGPVNLTAALPSGQRRLEAVEAHGLVVGVDDKLWRVDATGHALPLGQAAAVTGPGLRVGERLTLNDRPSAQNLPLALPAGPGSRAAAVLRDLPREIGVETPLDESLVLVAEKARAVASLRRDAHGVETLVLRQAGQAARPLVTINAQLADVDFATLKAVSHVGPHGEALKSWLYLPPRHVAGQKLPLVVIPYAGRNWTSPPARNTPPASNFFLNVQLLAGAGYAVLMPSLPLDERREPAQGLADDILKVVDAAGAAEPDLDLTRMALVGHSYGGWTVLTAATQTDRFKAIIASAFNSDLVGHYGRSSIGGVMLAGDDLYVMADAGWSELGQGRMGAPPWIDPQRYIRNSAFYAADKITTPTMLIMGDLDNDPSQSMLMFGAFYRQNKDAISLIYHGEGHVLQSPANIADMHARISSFLKDTIGPGS